MQRRSFEGIFFGGKVVAYPRKFALMSVKKKVLRLVTRERDFEDLSRHWPAAQRAPRRKRDLASRARTNVSLKMITFMRFFFDKKSFS